MKHPIPHQYATRREAALNASLAYADSRFDVYPQPLSEDDRALRDAMQTTPLASKAEGDDSVLESPEHSVCRRLVELLERQCTHRVAAALKTLQDELAEAQNNPDADVSLCQLGHALSHIAEANYEEAKRILLDLSLTAMHDEFIASTVMLALSRLGLVRFARQLAFIVRERFDQSADTLQKVMFTFENCLDFAEASVTATRCLKLANDTKARIALNRKLTIYSVLAWRAEGAALNSSVMLSGVEHAVSVLTRIGHPLHRIQLRGDHEETIRMEFDINASRSFCDESSALDEAMEAMPEGIWVDAVVPFFLHSATECTR